MAGAAAVYDPVASFPRMPTFRGWKLNRVEGQSCCGAVLTATLRHTEGGRRPRGILHMKRVPGMKYEALNVFARYQVFVLAVCSTSHSMDRGRSFSKFPPTYVLTHEMNPRLAIYVWISAEIS